MVRLNARPRLHRRRLLPTVPVAALGACVALVLSTLGEPTLAVPASAAPTVGLWAAKGQSAPLTCADGSVLDLGPSAGSKSPAWCLAPYVAPTTSTTTTEPRSTSAPPTRPVSSTLALGSYNGAARVGRARAFATLTGTTASIYSEYLDGSSWSSMVGGPGSPPRVIRKLEGRLDAMRLVLSVPLVHAGYSSYPAALAAYAANPSAWDVEFATLAQNLVDAGFGDAVIRLMWEPDVGMYGSGDLASAANDAALWRDAWTSMMSVAGAHFEWAWYYGASFDAKTNATAWPGARYVDTVTFDFYDQSWNRSCGIPYDGSAFTATQEACLWRNDFGSVLGGLTQFARRVGKPISIGEWGVIDRSDGHGGGDDPTFVDDFTSWMKANRVTWASYFNFDSAGNSTLSAFPRSLAAFRADLGS